MMKTQAAKWPVAWKHLVDSLQEVYNEPVITNCIGSEHIQDTPRRICESMAEMFYGCVQDPKEVLRKTFKDSYDEIVFVNDISFVSNCAHHNLPFFGKMHFGYLPKGKIVGLSKIPRLVEIFSRRPQVQEKLGQDIVDTFNQVIKPKGCGIVIEAWHLCMMIRGVKQQPAYTRTNVLRGTFKTNPSTKQEFLNGIKQTSRQIWP